jgi:coenzyme F420-0:L-glutamate ligase / coenzyme F420-1:gamma-L-glutamate ligase
MVGPLQIWALTGMPEVGVGDDLATLILESVSQVGIPLVDGDILVVTSKIVSKAEGRMMAAADREDAITQETVRVVATRPGPGAHPTRIVENRLGIVGAAAGVDASNTPDGTVLLLPLDPDASAVALADALRRRTGARLGVIVSDTLGRPWREGQTDIAIGAAGVHVFDELGGTADSHGRPLIVTRPCLADEIAAAGDLVKGKTSGSPVAVVRGLGAHLGDLDLPGARSIVRASDRDMFHLGSDEAHRQGYEAGFEAGSAAARAALRAEEKE